MMLAKAGQARAAQDHRARIARLLEAWRSTVSETHIAGPDWVARLVDAGNAMARELECTGLGIPCAHRKENENA